VTLFFLGESDFNSTVGSRAKYLLQAFFLSFGSFIINNNNNKKLLDQFLKK
jgi:hypothetical protein